MTHSRWRSAATLYGVLFGFLAVQTAAASAQHAHDALIRGGQGDPPWLPWTLAGTPELLAVIATLEYRHRRKRWGDDADVRPAVAVIVAAALVLMGAQLVTAQRTALGWFAAAWPALAFLVALALVETRPRPATATTRRKTAAPPPPAVPVPVPVPEEEAPPVGVAARLAALSPQARTVWDELTADAVESLSPLEIRDRTGLGKDAAYRAVSALVRSDLVATVEGGKYAARRLEGVA
jgi:hypothetical protein